MAMSTSPDSAYLHTSPTLPPRVTFGCRVAENSPPLPVASAPVAPSGSM